MNAPCQLPEQVLHPIPGQMEIEVDTRLRRLLLMDRTVDLLIEKAKAAECWPELYERALQVLQTLPLGTNDFTLAAQRIQNALAYANDSEYGAAAFELRLVRGQLAA